MPYTPGRCGQESRTRQRIAAKSSSVTTERVWAEPLPDSAVLEIGGVLLYVLHDVKTLGLDPRARGFAVVVSGHSHQPRAEERDGVLFFNPGSAGPRRFRLPVTVGRLTISAHRLRPAIIPLEPRLGSGR